MSKKDKLISRLQGKPKDFTWGEALAVMNACNFDLHSARGSGRMFVHKASGVKVRLHEPHPRKTLLPYMVNILLEGLSLAGEA